ncbi:MULTISPECIES: GMC family oxidoreductase [Citromicrobium]|uniref:GMC family oxidoreductase n=1 Tax=Citromicrobium TaxID=72173 RepID=UPI000705C07E|nr:MULTISPECIES: GMC family oxidoreductase N-terminal domain-containing protein [Citromicrobium]ALG60446.1 hypothetical protein WG74_06010 [Citromicrobium sp. JL477]
MRDRGKSDVIVVGGGAAGCVLANRLSTNPAREVLVLEAGPPDRHPMIRMPKGVGKILSDPAHVWPFKVAGRAGDNIPPGVWVRGKTLGGSSSTNGMMYVRGKPADYEALAEKSGEEWGWSHIARAFDALEGEGGLRTSFPPHRPELDAVLEAAENLGLEKADDPNDPDALDAVGYCPQSVWRGKRQSSAAAFLDPARDRDNLTIETGVTIDRVLFESGRAIGVTGLHNGARKTWYASEVILSCGTLGSPAILERSGIGDPERLGALDIPITAPNSAVGENLFEHSGITLQWRTKPGFSLNREYSGLRLLKNAGRYFLQHKGPLASGTFDVIGWFRTSPDADRPDAQMLFAPHSIDRTKATMATEPFPGVQAVIYPLRPRARGSLHIVSRDPNVLPEGSLDFFADQQDRHELVDTVRFVRRLAKTAPLSDIIIEETRPGPHAETDREIIDSYRLLGTPAYHAAGTCRMGTDRKSVVDPHCRVRGVEGLRVVDLSIAPVMPAGNTFAPVCAIAWRAAELIQNDLQQEQT